MSFTLTSTSNFTGAVQYSCVNGCPAGLAVTVGTGAVSWTPTLSQAGSYTIRFRAEGTGDGAGSSDEKEVSVSVADNQAPTLAAVSNQSLSPGDALSLTLSGSDPDADTTLTYSCHSGCPTGLSVNASTGVVTFHPRASDLGVHSVTFRAHDGEKSADRAATIDVNLLGSGALGTATHTSDVTGTCYVIDSSDTTAGTVTVSGLAGLDLTGKRLLLHQTQDRVTGYASGTATSLSDANLPADAGKWEIVKVTARTGATPDVLTVQPKPLHAFSSSAERKAQACVALEYQNLTMTDGGGGTEVKAPEWNGSTGGIVFLMVRSTLTLNASTAVFAPSRGYRGGVLRTDTQWTHYNKTFTDTNWAYGAAAKGEGPDPLYYNGNSAQAYSTTTPTAECNHGATYSDCYSSGYWLGRGNVFLGGRGGGGIVAGGGGGGLGGDGGYGGWQMAEALMNDTHAPEYTVADEQNPNVRGLPGVDFDFANLKSTRLFFGGGGGAGHSDSDDRSRGGDGGGLVLLGAGTLAGTGALNANGEAGQISSAVHKGGGGGGAGGLLWLEIHALHASQMVSVTATGGAGSNNNLAEGTGGGGGGGIVHMPRVTLPAAQINVSGGSAGTYSGDARGATAGAAGIVSP